ncbi:hypothetical protein HYC85_002910 [Camellia sinensis]|uniref:CASP-like protein n=1 Tax=Camellia sinensis TaxID=4442 RepID=A0A7J7IAV5_CAMSI|nr:hypothetical protein HYC85_002910 [Camellia sinensis]
MEKKMENQENKTISEEEPTTAHAIADSSPAQSPSPSPPRDPKPSLPSARSPAESSVSSDLSHRTSLSHGSSPRENPPENVKSPSPQPVVNRFVREEPVAVTKLDPGPGIGDVEGGGSERRTRRSLSILRRVKREKMVKKAALWLRIWGLVFCLISFAVMASDKNKGWALDSFYRYKEFRYCISVNVVGFMYSAVQACDLAYHFSTGNYVVRHQLRYYFDFLMDQILTYLLMSASSSAATRVDDWISNWGNDKFPAMASASVGVSFVAFVALASSSLISGYTLFTFRST